MEIITHITHLLLLNLYFSIISTSYTSDSDLIKSTVHGHSLKKTKKKVHKIVKNERLLSGNFQYISVCLNIKYKWNFSVIYSYNYISTTLKKLWRIDLMFDKIIKGLLGGGHRYSSSRRKYSHKHNYYGHKHYKRGYKRSSKSFFSSRSFFSS